MSMQGRRFPREPAQVGDRGWIITPSKKERGITILAKNTSMYYNGVKINASSIPRGHADFGGEVCAL